MFPTEQRLSVLRHWDKVLTRQAFPASFTPSHTQRLAIRTVAVGTGLSGGEVFRVELADNNGGVAPDRSQSCWALKAWPSATTGEHIERISAIVRAAAPHCGLLAPPLPRGDIDSPLVREHGRYWEVARWIPGSPLPESASAEAIARGGEAIASVHAAMNLSARSSTNGRPSVVPRCIVDRIARIQSITPLLGRIADQTRRQDELVARLAAQLTTEQQGSQSSAFHCETLAKTLLQASEWLTRQWPAVETHFVARLREHGRAYTALPSFWVLRDVHREHVLFERDTHAKSHAVSGILDYDAVAFDSPAVDLARWAGDFDAKSSSFGISTGRVDISAGSSEQSPLHAAVAGYREIRPFSQCEWALAETLTEVNRLGALANWLVWLVLEHRRFSGSAQQIQGRISHLIAADCRTW